MLVDDKQAREKMARICEARIITGRAWNEGQQIEANTALGCAAAIREADLSDCAPIGSPPIDKLMVAQGLQDAMFAHPQSGPIPVQVGFVELAIEALRTPDTRDSVESLSAQVAAMSDAHTRKREEWELLCAEQRQRAVAAEAQVAELKKDAERMEFVLLHTWVSDGQRLHIAFEHEYNEAMQGIALALIDRAMADAAKESGVSP